MKHFYLILLMIITSLQIQANDQLTQEVQKYLSDIKAPSDVSAQFIVHTCLQENFDITFLLTQGTIETGMGKAGTGKSKNSVFGVRKKSYKSKHDSIVYYIRLIKNSYLINNNFTNLMNRFISKSGHHYDKPGYEQKFKKTYNKIKSKYKIHSLQYN